MSSLVEALFSPCGRHRYRLDCRWAPGPAWAWVMLNPSIAGSGITGDDLDPTLRRCRGFSRAGGAGAMVVLNLFSWRSTDPAGLWAAFDAGEDIHGGAEADRLISRTVAEADLVVCGWGGWSRGARRHQQAGEARAQAVMGMARNASQELFVLRLTRGGQPAHPLYLPGGLRPLPWG